jgi:phospholipase C
MVIASPWTRGGWVDSQVFDHTSSLRFLEQFIRRRFGKDVREDNISSWRRTIAGDLTSVFRPWRGDPVALPAFLDQRTWIGTILQAKQQPEPDPGRPLSVDELAQVARDPSQSARLPKQEPGTRPATALPYDLMVDGALDAARSAVRLDLRVLTRLFGATTAGAPFQVHALSGEVTAEHDVQVRDFAVAPGEDLSATWPLSDFRAERYHLRVYGPNGFYRELRGGSDDPPVSVSAQTEVSPMGGATGNLRVVVGAAAAAPSVRVLVTANGQAPQARDLSAGSEIVVSLPLGSNHGWYDLAVAIDGAAGFVRHYAGRIETGLPTRTDPVMGRETPS